MGFSPDCEPGGIGRRLRKRGDQRVLGAEQREGSPYDRVDARRENLDDAWALRSRLRATLLTRDLAARLLQPPKPVPLHRTNFFGHALQLHYGNEQR